MTRKKVNLSWIVNDSARKTSLKKRRVGLLKKVSELSTLCDVSASVIIYSPGDREPMTYPSPERVKESLARFHSMPEMERNKKMMNQETYLKERVGKIEDQFNKQQKKDKEMEASSLIHYAYERNGFHEFNLTDLKSVEWFVQEKRNDIKKRIDFFHQAPLSPGSLPLAPDQAPLLVPNQMAPDFGDNIMSESDHLKSTTEAALWDQWFIDMVNSTENVAGSSSNAGLSTPYQPFAANSNYENQLGLVGPGNYKPHFGDETVMDLQPYGGPNMPMLTPPQPPQVGGISGGSDFAMGLQPYGGFSDLQGTGGSDMTLTMAQPPSHFDGSGGGANGYTLDRQSYGNVRGGGNLSTGGNMGSPSGFDGGNIIAASDVGSPYDVNKESPPNFIP
ncbi:hypothetical protein ACOSQ3_029289 [Xanthoceras sorbifolium]